MVPLLFILLSSCPSPSESYPESDVYPCDTVTREPATVINDAYTATTPGSTQPWTTPGPAEGDLVLRGGSGPHQGNVHVRGRSGNHGTILTNPDPDNHPGGDSDWRCPEAEVVCRQLGYTGAESFSVHNKYASWQDPGVEALIWRHVSCNGYEDRLEDCSYAEVQVPWDTDSIAGVSCINTLPSTTTAPNITTPPPTPCPAGWLDAGPLGCFLIQPGNTVNNWYSAQLMCESLGGFLAEPKTAEIQHLLASLLAMLPEVAGGLDWWIGLSDSGHEGAWLWTHEADFAESHFWADSAPDTQPGNDLDCALLSLADSFLWRDVACWGPHGGVTAGVICQR